MMMRELITSTRHYHNEHLRRHIRIPEPMKRPRHELRRAIGHSLIHLGETLARVDQTSQFDEAA